MRCALFAVVLVSVGCQSPRVVQRTADEGIVALPANSDSFPHYHQSAAKKIIAAHLGANYEIVEEKEVTTGYTTTNMQDRQSELTMHSSVPFLPASRETTTTKTVATPQKEWQIHYRRLMPRPPTGLATAPPAANVVTTAYVSGQPTVGLPATPVPMPPLGAPAAP